MLNRLEQGATRRGWGGGCSICSQSEGRSSEKVDYVTKVDVFIVMSTSVRACARSLSSPKTCESSLSPPPSSSFVNSTMSIFCVRIS